MTGVDALVAVASLGLGYAIGSLPLSALVGRVATAPGPGAPAEPTPSGFIAVWRFAGPGWGFLALVADLARGVLPVTLAAATFTWGASWAAGLGALAGAVWPALGRLHDTRGAGVLPTVLAGVIVALEPPIVLAAAILAPAVLGGRRALRRTARKGV